MDDWLTDVLHELKNRMCNRTFFLYGIPSTDGKLGTL